MKLINIVSYYKSYANNHKQCFKHIEYKSCNINMNFNNLFSHSHTKPILKRIT
jgi:hypothetical protein